MNPSLSDSAWRKFPVPRIARRRPGRPRKHPQLNMFYGYPADLIAKWCDVAHSTALAYKTGRVKLSKPVMKLFRLHRDRMVMTPERKGWLVTSNALVDPEGNETSRGLLRGYYLMIQYCRELAKRAGGEEELERSRRILAA